MTDQPDFMTIADVKTVAANVAAARLAQRYTLAAVIMALGKAKALEVADVHLLLGTLSAVFASARKDDPSAIVTQAYAIAAEELAAIEPMIRNMLTIPPGAGRA